MVFLRDILFPVVVFMLSLSIIIFVINFVFRLIKFDVDILKFVSFLVIWYYVGPVIYNWFDYHILSVKYEAIKILYMPIQYIMMSLEKIL